MRDPARISRESSLLVLHTLGAGLRRGLLRACQRTPAWPGSWILELRLPGSVRVLGTTVRSSLIGIGISPSLHPYLILYELKCVLDSTVCCGISDLNVFDVNVQRHA